MLNILDQISQYTILILGPLAIWILARKDQYARYGFIIGLASQPFWFYTLTYNRQWPILIVSIVYAVAFAKGVYNNFIRRDK